MSELGLINNKSIILNNSNIQYQQFGKEIEIESDEDEKYLYKLLDLPEALREILLSKKIPLNELRNIPASQLADILSIDPYIANLIVMALKKL